MRCFGSATGSGVGRGKGVLGFAFLFTWCLNSGI